MITDEQISDVLMVGYGYHREWDYLNNRSHWVKGWLPGAPTPSVNIEPEQLDELEQEVSDRETDEWEGLADTPY